MAEPRAWLVEYEYFDSGAGAWLASRQMSEDYVLARGWVELFRRRQEKYRKVSEPIALYARDDAKLIIGGPCPSGPYCNCWVLGSEGVVSYSGGSIPTDVALRQAQDLRRQLAAVKKELEGAREELVKILSDSIPGRFRDQIGRFAGWYRVHPDWLLCKTCERLVELGKWERNTDAISDNLLYRFYRPIEAAQSQREGGE